MLLTVADIRLILKLLAEKYGSGYSDHPEIGILQAKLSVMLELAMQYEQSHG